MRGVAILRADAGRIPLEDRSVDLAVGSPPYLDARLYREGGKGDHRRGLEAWIDWMLGVTAESLRVSRGLVIWVVAGVTRDHCYRPGPEGLLYRWVAEEHGAAWRPVYWHRVGIPGSGREHWYRSDIEYCLAFKRPGKYGGHGDPKANGKPPKFPVGGAPSYRTPNGNRVGVRNSAGRRPDGSQIVQAFVQPDIANPGNYFLTKNGGHLGHGLAHENEAPYPVDVPKFFIRSHCPEGGLVLDPFGGSGTTGQAALEEGRSAILCDLRMSQCRLARRRCATITPRLVGLEA